jgi:hypothetical protein
MYDDRGGAKMTKDRRTVVRYANATLQISWHKIMSGRYEIVIYIG